jgi:hypothetical protein
MSNDGLESIIRAIEQLESEVRETAHAVQRNEQRIERIEDDMSRLADVLQDVGRSIEDRVEAANTLLDRMITQIGETNVRLGAVEEKIEGGLERQTGAMVQLEITPLVADASLAVRRAEDLQSDINTRFDKAWEGVFLNRVLYDKHFESIRAEYEAKLHKVGDHIFAVLDDLRAADEAARIPDGAASSLSIEVDLATLGSRSALLDEDLETLHRERLLPLVSLEERFEQTMASEFALDPGIPDGTRVLVPGAVAVGRHGATILIDSIASHNKATAGVTISPRGELPEHFAAVANPAWTRVAMDGSPSRPMTAAEIQYLKDALGRLAHKGLISTRMLGGYLQYVDIAPLELLIPIETSHA